jgi:hypothetical protein
MLEVRGRCILNEVEEERWENYVQNCPSPNRQFRFPIILKRASDTMRGSCYLPNETLAGFAHKIDPQETYTTIQHDDRIREIYSRARERGMKKTGMQV